MNWSEFLAYADRLFNTTLFSLSGQAVTLVTILVFLLILLLTFWTARLVEQGVERALSLRGVSDAGLTATVGRLIRYLVLIIGFSLALQNVGLDLGALFAAGAIFAVGLGFAMQGIVQNFVSGIVLLAERAIKNGDILEVESHVVRVTRMGLRATVARTRDDEDLIIPNGTLAQTTIKNYTLRDAELRLKVGVGVVYGSDMRQVMEVLRDAASALRFRVQEREPRVLLTAFADSSVNFEVQIWTTDPWASRTHESDLNQAIWWALKDAGITIAFPQLDVHLDPPVVEAIARMPRAG